MAKRFSIIDIGTSSIKLLVVEIGKNGTLANVHKERIEPKLLRNDIGSVKKGGLPKQSIKARIGVLKDLQSKARNWKVERIKVASTEAFRKAKNSQDIIEKIKNETGLDVEVISQKREAELFWKGVIGDFPKKTRIAAIDVGGGTVQFAYGTKEKLEEILLLDTGVFRLKEDLNLSDPFTGNDIENFENKIIDAIRELNVKLGSDVPLVHGSSEVINFYDELKVPFEKSYLSKNHPHKVSLDTTWKNYEMFKKMNISQRKRLTPSLPGYAHGAVLGLANVLLIAQKTGIEYELPSNANITDGLIQEMLEG